MPFSLVPEGVLVRVRLTPKASANAMKGVARDEEGRRRLKVQVTPPPVDGKANAALIKVLAKAWKVPKSTLSVVQGASGRNKTIRIAGGDEVLLQQIKKGLEGEHG